MLDPGPGRLSSRRDPRDLRRRVRNAGEALHYNVIQITVESLSGHYLGRARRNEGLTPRLDALARDGLLFTNFYATGTRTVRGMEALTLSVPPTPGESIVKRPHNGDLFTLGSVFRERGYDTVFLYGGFGYFDNMNAFFSGNGYRVVDRSSVPADADPLRQRLGRRRRGSLLLGARRGGRAHARGQPFHHFVMTTSNHRPFTYPDGRIDIPSHSGRAGRGEVHRLGDRRFPRRGAQASVVRPHDLRDRRRSLREQRGAHRPARSQRYRIPLIVYAPGTRRAGQRRQAGEPDRPGADDPRVAALGLRESLLRQGHPGDAARGRARVRQHLRDARLPARTATWSC